MQIRVSRAAAERIETDALIVPLAGNGGVPRHVHRLDGALSGAIGRALESGEFKGKPGERLRLGAEGIAAQRVFLVGLGKGRPDTDALRRAAAAAVRVTSSASGKRAALLAPPQRGRAADDGRALAEGALLGAYRFDRYRTIQPPREPLESLELIASGASQSGLRSGVKAGESVAASTNFARDLSNEPGSVCTPAWLAARAREMAREVGLRARVFDEKELERRRMGGLLAVGRGSAHAPRMIVLEHGARHSGRRTVALVGKGITFDTGGISIKPAASMEEMKHDMSGGAAVLGALRAAALLRLPLHVVGIVPAAQNSPGGRAYLPGDVVRTASGKTIEVLNTDAEGRVVLADGLHFGQSFRPDAIVDLATLTGACIIALGRHCAALMGNDANLLERVIVAGQTSGERVWPLPLWDEHKKQIESHIADVKNTAGRDAATITAGAFLSHFVGEVPWAHLDIAGKESVSADDPLCVKGATGFGVRLLVALLSRWRRL
jgi:leucyl aminopeptidase